MNIAELRSERAQILTAQKACLDAWSPENEAKYNELKASKESIERQIEAHQEFLKADATDETIKANLDKVAGQGNGEQVIEAYAKYLTKGTSGLTSQELGILENAQEKQTDAAGGYTIPKILMPDIRTALKEFGGIRAKANVILTSHGNTIDYILTDYTSEVGELVGEGVEVTDQDTSFSTIALPTYKFSSKVFTVTKELAQDSAVNIVAHVQKVALSRIARLRAGFDLNGTGVNQPKGLLTSAVLGVTGGAGQTTTVIYDDLVKLTHSVDPAYRVSPSCAFFMHDTTWQAIKLLKDNNGRPLVWGDDVGMTSGVVGKLLGYDVVIVQEMPVMAASAKSIMFGDASAFTIRDVNYMPLSVYTDSVYDRKGQIGFVAWARGGSLYTSVPGAVKYYRNAAA